MKDFKQEATEYCKALDEEDNVEEDVEEDDPLARMRKESEEFHQLEAHFRGMTRFHA